jgi:ParB family chromosome partitioning protein
MKLAHIDQDKLSISKANMRDGKKPPDIADILPSVRARGVLVPLLVRANGSAETFEIVAGRRRYFASLTVANENGAADPLPCAIMEAGDDAAALEASLIENLARLDPDEVTQWENFTRLVKEGRNIDEISKTFGLPEQSIKCILALGNLLPRIRQAYQAQEIDVRSIRHLTLATKTQQKTWLAMFDDPDTYAPTGHNLKDWLFGGDTISTSVALFDLDSYQGRIVNDLFEAKGYFGDADAFFAAQTAAIEARKESYIDEGWSDVVIVPPNEQFRSWEYEKTPKRKGGRVYADIAPNGEVRFHVGYLTLKEAKRIAKGESVENVTKIIRPEITGTMATYLDLHRHAAVRAALTAKTGVALRLMVAHAMCGSALWAIKIEPQRAQNGATRESIETSIAEAKFNERRRAVMAMLDIPEDDETVTGSGEALFGLSGIFQRLLELPDPAVYDVMAIVMGETLASGSGFIETLGMTLNVDMTKYWVADDAFFSLIRDREVITRMVAEVAGETVASGNAAEPAKVQKQVLRDYLGGSNGRAKIEAWVPRWMAFPPSSYTNRGGIGMVNRHIDLAERRAALEQSEDEAVYDAHDAHHMDESEAEAEQVFDTDESEADPREVEALAA